MKNKIEVSQTQAKTFPNSVIFKIDNAKVSIMKKWCVGISDRPHNMIPDSIVRKFQTTVSAGENYELEYYNIDMHKTAKARV